MDHQGQAHLIYGFTGRLAWDKYPDNGVERSLWHFLLPRPVRAIIKKMYGLKPAEIW
jgi:hypothetical protein